MQDINQGKRWSEQDDDDFRFEVSTSATIDRGLLVQAGGTKF